MQRKVKEMRVMRRSPVPGDGIDPIQSRIIAPLCGLHPRCGYAARSSVGLDGLPGPD